MSAGSHSGLSNRVHARILAISVLPAMLVTALGCGGAGSASSAQQDTPAAVAPTAAATAATALAPSTATLAPAATQTFTASLPSATSAAWSVDGIANGNATVGTVAAQASQASFLRQAYFSTNTYSQAISVQAGDLIIVGFSVGNSLAKATCSDSAGNTYSAIGSGVASSVSGGSAYGFYGIAKSTGTTTVTVATANNSYPVIAVHVVGGISAAQSSVLDAYAVKADTAASTSHSTATIATGNASDYVFTMWSQDSSKSTIAENGTGFTIRNSDFVANAAAGKFVSATGSYAEAVTTGSSVGMASLVAAFKVTAAPGTYQAVYTAPAAGGSHTVSATGNGTTLSSAVTVQAPNVTVALTPATASASPSGSVSLAATVSGSTAGVTWSVDGVANGNSSVGTISGSGSSVTYVAPAASGSHVVTATSVANTSAKASTTINVVAGAAAVTCSVSPATATLAAGGSTTVTATVSGASSTAVNWTVDGVAGGNSSIGTITGTGNSVTYTAPAAAGSHSVVATSAANGSATGTLAVTVQAPVAVALNPATSASVTAAKTLSFAATVTGSSNTAVTWSVDGVSGGNTSVGTLTGSGNSMVYTAPAASGTHVVKAVSAADATKSASTTVSVQAASSTTTGVVLSPSAPTAVGSGGTLAFSATTTGSSTDTVTWKVDGVAGGNASVGTITSAGVYTCPTVSVHAIHTITATSVNSPAQSASVAILATVSNTVVNAKTQYGATGTDSTDDTSAINSALKAAGNGICYLPAGTYMINPTANGSYGLDIPAGTTLLMDPGTVLQAITQTTTGDYKVIRMAASNSAVVGGKEIGDRVARNLPTYQNGVGTTFEEGQGIAINGSGGATGIVILGTTLTNNCCDGIYMYNGVNGVTVQSVVSSNNRRQGLSIVYGTNVTIKNSTFSSTNGNDPGLGIDLEPSGTGQVVSYVTISGCTFSSNQGGGLGGGSSNASVNHITVDSNTFTGNGGYNYQYGGLGFNDGSSYCTITNNVITNNLPGSNQGGMIINGTSNFVVSGNTVKNNAGWGIVLASTPGTSCSGNTVTGNTSGQIYNDGSAAASSNTLQ
jgi:parallel beta-helix repeat protein